MEGRKVQVQAVPRAPELSTEGPSPAGFKTYSAAGSADRISLVSGHLSHQTPSYNLASPALSSSTQARPLSTSTANMSSQPEHATLLIPGPIEFDDEVLNESHVGPGFVNTFGETLSLTRKLFQSTDPSAQPYVISGSGTLGWDIVAANLVEAGEDALVLSTGYFGDGFADCLRAYGANVTKLDGEVGGRPQLPEIEKALSEKKYKILTVTHVDTSTGVLSELKNLAATVKRVSPETLVIVDGVCSVACEEIAFDEWGLDGVVTASQKAIGVPAGLSISFFSGRAVAAALENRKTPIPAYFASMKNWTPIMKNYEAKKPSYFATPSPQLVHALHTSLTQILSRPLSERFQAHIEVSNKVKKAITDLGLKIVATKPEDQAHAMTAIYLPEGVGAPDVLPKLAGKGVVFAGGIHKAIAPKYIRFGHMGVSALDPSRGHMEKAINALKESLFEAGYKP
ncbi:alanine-glyoxylate transaminase r-3-amino-2-methylpropionate-pyruvate transaminase [Fusarium longipes]|uniref:alanine--glyoxylate transaminase n=1 Tax=Fusarium longipes TaxID=694270 RepID=A0A395RIM8_9HYPO|nr:alanine-glyoxylate transaminase r-3-amino-2-methylpropionate-pyruvate transaminase [Fusarium longipes]